MTDQQKQRYVDLNFSYYSGPDDGVIEFQKVRVVKVRKPHPCAVGIGKDGHVIAAGMECVADTAKYDGQVGTCYTCLKCLDKWGKEMRF